MHAPPKAICPIYFKKCQKCAASVTLCYQTSDVCNALTEHEFHMHNS